jgi:hypothetical protein
VAVAVEGAANRLYLNDGQGRLTWREGALGTEGHDTEHVLSADFNQDGFPDLVFVAEDDMAHSYFLGGPGESSPTPPIGCRRGARGTASTSAT